MLWTFCEGGDTATALGVPSTSGLDDVAGSGSKSGSSSQIGELGGAGRRSFRFRRYSPKMENIVETGKIKIM